MSFAFGITWKKIVRDYFLDSRFKILRFRNYWHYIFTGEILNFPNIPGDPVDASSAYLDLICTIGDQNYIYRGFLLDYQLSKEHELESLALFGVKRRKLSNDFNSNDKNLSEGSDPYYTIQGQFIVFKYDEIKHINITYYNLEVEADEKPESKGLIVSNPALKKGWFLFHLGWISFFVLYFRYLLNSIAEPLLFPNQYLDSIFFSSLFIIIISSISNNQVRNAYQKTNPWGTLIGILLGLIATCFMVFLSIKTTDIALHQIISVSAILIAMGSISGAAKGWFASLVFVLIGILVSIYFIYSMDENVSVNFSKMVTIILGGLFISWLFRLLIIVDNFQAYWKKRFLQK
nr:hypothetical protein [uncultured Allomuricauda sp.]